MKQVALIGLTCFLYAAAFTQGAVFYPVAHPALQSFDIRKVCAGNDGRLWLCTNKGLVCYDGNDVTIYSRNPKDSATLRTNNLWDAVADRRGNLIVTGYLQNLDYFDTKTGKVRPVHLQLAIKEHVSLRFPVAFSQVFVDDDEMLWVGVYNIGMAYHDLKTGRNTTYFLRDNLLAGDNSVYAISKDKTRPERLWLGTGDGIYSFDKTTKKMTRAFRCSRSRDSSNSDMQVLFLDTHQVDSIWFATPHGMGSYSVKTGVYTLYPAPLGDLHGPLDINGAQRKSNHEFYITSTHMLPGIFNTNTHQYYFNATTAQRLPNLSPSHFLADSAGNLWCVLFNRLFQAGRSQSRFATITLQQMTSKHPSLGNFETAIWDAKRRCYYAVFGNSKSLQQLDEQLHLKNNIPALLPKSPHQAPIAVQDIALDAQNQLWACGSTLWVYDAQQNKLVPSFSLYPKLVFADQLFQNLIPAGNYLYLQPSNPHYKAIYRINLKAFTYDSIPLPEEMQTDPPLSNPSEKRLDRLMLDTLHHFAYFGYNSGGFKSLVQLNLNTGAAKKVASFVSYEFNQVPNENWYAIDDSSRIWISTSDDLIIYDAATLKQLSQTPVPQDTYNMPIYNLSGRGLLCKLYPTGLLLYDYKKGQTFEATASDSLFATLHSRAAFSNNRLFVGAGNFLQSITPAALTSHAIERTCFLSSFRVFDQRYPTDTLPQYLHSLTLPHDKNGLSLTFSSLAFERPQELRYRYKLTGVDNDWIQTDYRNRTISYHDLQPGNYTFFANVKNQDGTWSSTGVALAISILPAWWQTVLFKTLFFLAIAFLIYALISIRIKYVRRQERLKTVQEKKLLELEARSLRAQMNPHFIFNSMNAIKSLIQQGEESKAVAYLTTFSKLLRVVLQNSNKRAITLYDELETCRLYMELERARFETKFQYAIHMEEGVDLKSMKVPALILQPFIENAIWHGILPQECGGSITISIKQTAHSVICEIDDNGIGRDRSRQNKLNENAPNHESKGLHLTQSRLDLDAYLNDRNTTLKIVDKKTNDGNAFGTKVILTFEKS